MRVMTNSGGDRGRPWKILLLMSTAPRGDPPENKSVFQFFMALFRSYITFLGAPIRSRDFNSQLFGTMSLAFQQSIQAMLKLLLHLSQLRITAVPMSKWPFVRKDLFLKPFCSSGSKS